jgi:hypothetical protein
MISRYSSLALSYPRCSAEIIAEYRELLRFVRWLIAVPGFIVQSVLSWNLIILRVFTGARMGESDDQDGEDADQENED